MQTLQSGVYNFLLEKLNEELKKIDENLEFLGALFFFDFNNKLQKTTKPTGGEISLSTIEAIAISLQPENDIKPIQDLIAIDYIWTIEMAIKKELLEKILRTTENFRNIYNGASIELIINAKPYVSTLKVFDNFQPKQIDTIYGGDFTYLSFQVNFPVTDNGVFGQNIIYTLDGHKLIPLTIQSSTGKATNENQKVGEATAKIENVRDRTWQETITILLDRYSDLYDKIVNELEAIGENNIFVRKKTYPGLPEITKNVIIENITSLEEPGGFVSLTITFREFRG